MTRRTFMRQSGLTGFSLLGVASLVSACSSGSISFEPTATPNSFASHFSLANPFGIQTDDSGDVWNAGHINDLLERPSDSVLAASQSGGIWLLTASGNGVPLSLDWDSPDANALAQGPDNQDHVFAGCTNGLDSNKGAVYVTVSNVSLPLLAPWAQIPLPDAVGAVRRIVVFADTRRIVLATTRGIFWSSIPTTPGGAGYTWMQATGLPNPNGDFSGLALGVGQTVVASAFGADVAHDHYGIFTGTWVGSALIFSRATIMGADTTQMGCTSVASCAANRQMLYAISAAGDGTIFALLRSSDGGTTWNTVSATLIGMPTTNLHDLAGDQGNGWNNCLAVSATNPTIFAFGWRNGPFYSTDSGAFCHITANRAGLHQDQHALLFTSANELYIGSDGGVVRTPDLGDTITSTFNRRLANLQFLGPTGNRQWWGTMGASYQTAGLIAGGLQDNDNVYSQIDASGTANPWRQLYTGADGGAMTFLRTNGVMSTDIGRPAGYAHWNGSQFGNYTEMPIRRTAPDGPATGTSLNGAVVEIVNEPTYHTSSGEYMYAVAGHGADIYGLFANGNITNDVPSADLHWDYLGSAPIDGHNSFIAAIGSSHGRYIFVGTRGNAQIYLLDVTSPGTVLTSLGMPTGVNFANHIGRVIVQSDLEAFAFRNGDGTGAIYHTTDGRNWSQLHGGLPSDYFYCMDTDWTKSPKTLFVATDNAVYASRNNGGAWENVTNGLPKRAHCSDMRFVTQANGYHYLYVSTFGWSIWRARLT